MTPGAKELNDGIKTLFRLLDSPYGHVVADAITEIQTGMMLAKLPIETLSQQYRDCTACGHLVASCHSYCTDCGNDNPYWKENAPNDFTVVGMDLEAQKCAGCNSYFAGGYVYCPYCGSRSAKRKAKREDKS